MADKTVVVALRALIGDYQAKMAAAAKSTAAVGQAGKATDSNLTTMGKSAREVGAGLTKYVSLPLAAAGFAAGKLAVDFEDAFAKMQGLAGVAADEVEGLKETVLDLAKQTGEGPRELAEGLYFVRSAGLAGQAAIDAITISAKAAAAGLGETASVADAVTSAMLAYGEANLSAAKAGDILVATARAGKAEASELAPQFGRLLPVASELGISFDQVGAGLAFLSRTSGDAALSATQLDGVMQKLLKPSQQGREALEKALGVNAIDQLRKSIQERGLLATLQQLRERLGDSGFNILFDDQQGLQGALALTGARAQEARDVFADLADTTGDLDGAFGAASETSGFKMRQAFAELQAAAIQLGDAILPMLGDVASKIGALVGVFGKLPKPAQDGLVILGGYALVIGPLINIVGRFAEQLGKMRTKILEGAEAGQSFGKSLGRGGLAYNVGLATGALTLGLVALDAFNNMMASSRRQGEAWADQFSGGFDINTSSFDQLQGRISELSRVIGNIRGSKDSALEFWNADSNAELDAAADRLGTTRDQLIDMRNKAIAVSETMKVDFDTALRVVTGHQGDLNFQTKDGTTSFNEEAAAVALVTDKLKQQADTLKAQLDPMFAVIDASDGNRDAQLRVEEAYRKVEEAEAALLYQRTAFGPNSREAEEASRDLAEAQREVGDANLDAVRSAQDVNVALLNLAQGVADGSVSIDAARMNLQAWVDQGLITQAQADMVSGRLSWVAGQASGIANTVAGLNAGGLNMQATAPGLDQTKTTTDGLSVTVTGLNEGGLTINVTTPGLPEAQAGVDELKRHAEEAARAYIEAVGAKYGLETPPTAGQRGAEGYVEGAGQPEGHAWGGRLGMGWNLVGEDGPELIGPDRRVYPASQTARMLTPHSSYASSTSTTSTDNSRTYDVTNNNYGPDPRSQARHNADELRALSMLDA